MTGKNGRGPLIATAPSASAGRPATIWVLAGTAAAFLQSLASAAQPQTVSCSASDWIVTGGTADERRLICEGVAKAEALLGSCGIRTSEPVDLVVADSLLDFCGSKAHAVFDSRDKTISIAPMDVCVSERIENGYFDLLNPQVAYLSIAAHEATHAILDANGIRPKQWVGNEYMAAIVQYAAIPPEERDDLIEALMEPVPVSAEEINGVIYGFAPLIFAARSWLHYSALPQPCAFLNDVVSGAFSFVDIRY